jgi:uncharacterized LabA/DUF88 family protein
MSEDLAIFIDWENIYISTVTEYKTKPNVSAMLEKAQEFGRVVWASAYADWTDGEFREAPPTLYSNGISPRYISARYYPGGKSAKRRTNSIDVMLAVECSDFLHNHPQVDTYVLVTGDGDFIPLINLLRSQGKQVVVIGVSEASSYHLIESADHFISYSSLLEEGRAARGKGRESKKKPSDPYKELVRAVEALKKTNKPRVLGQVKQQMLVQVGSFDERKEGFKKFKDFVVEAEGKGLVKTVDQDFELQVYLPDESLPEAEESTLPSEDGHAAPQEEEADMLGELTPYEFGRVCTTISELGERASFVEIFDSIRRLEERGELELTEEEIGEVISAMLEGGHLTRTRARPYTEAAADLTFYELDMDSKEVQAGVNGG